jgi:hypothetical protein
MTKVEEIRETLIDTGETESDSLWMMRNLDDLIAAVAEREREKIRGGAIKNLMSDTYIVSASALAPAKE